jgi:hypothetical protein
VVSADYHIVQPAEILNFFGELAEKKHFTIETVGSLMEGRRIWAMGRVGDNARILDDEVAPYLLLATSYDGTMATLARFTTVRVVCNNTLQAAMRNSAGQKQVTISHQAIFDAAGVRADLGIALDAWDEFQAKATTMARRKVSAADEDAYLQGLFEPFMPYGQSYSPEQVRKSKGYGRILDLFHSEMIGGDQDAAKAPFGACSTPPPSTSTTRRAACRTTASTPHGSGRAPGSRITRTSWPRSWWPNHPQDARATGRFCVWAAGWPMRYSAFMCSSTTPPGASHANPQRPNHPAPDAQASQDDPRHRPGVEPHPQARALRA